MCPLYKASEQEALSPTLSATRFTDADPTKPVPAGAVT